MDSPNGEFDPFVRTMLRSMASGLGCSFEAIVLTTAKVITVLVV